VQWARGASDKAKDSKPSSQSRGVGSFRTCAALQKAFFSNGAGREMWREYLGAESLLPILCLLGTGAH
jgi:hypothetical protein